MELILAGELRPVDVDLMTMRHMVQMCLVLFEPNTDALSFNWNQNKDNVLCFMCYKSYESDFYIRG